MNQVRHVTLGLLDLPVEILLDMLGHLDVYELVRACQVAQVCNDIRHVIDPFSELLYSIDLEFFNAIPVPSPGPDRTVSSLRKSLRQSESTWQKAECIKRHPISMPKMPPGTYQWSCGILAFPLPGESLQQITFFQPQPADSDHANSTSSCQWGCQIDRAVSHYTTSPLQNLLIVLVRAPLGSLGYNNVHQGRVTPMMLFSDHSEDKVHPEAASAVVKALDNKKYSQRRWWSGRLFANLKLEVKGHFSVPWARLYNDGFQFPSEKPPVANTRELLLYSLVHFTDAPHITAKFLLPALQTSFEYKFVGFNPIPSYARTHNHIIAISMDISEESLTTYAPAPRLVVLSN
ncbi:hypothetical protein DFJ58DRAFT_858717 [Suillus subalutaceus]|uniref:uncharacterized protein n=1 Tax=Suillus subalutaceus TaxID=48586 RepID=UPI001B85DE69|nr:uncharacterized protein DFJ58DRAFT_858717 [Suillus subalutaceus]KAG1868260.1 hypothetical protein DFJ58DRAFT_858717 [Suillus subalutaceus]